MMLINNVQGVLLFFDKPHFQKFSYGFSSRVDLAITIVDKFIASKN